jgi:hypothetical protein
MDVIRMMANAQASDDPIAKDAALSMAGEEIKRLRDTVRRIRDASATIHLPE